MALESFNNWTATCARDYRAASVTSNEDPYCQWVASDPVSKHHISSLSWTTPSINCCRCVPWEAAPEMQF